MQLRVARLCLDCEEVYAGSACPVCASERHAFLSAWLPVEERRRWRRSGPRPAPPAGNDPLSRIRRAWSRWFGEGDPDEAKRTIRTRRSDHIPDLSFEEPEPKPQKQAARVRQPAKGDVSP
jgi:hypothetical protein